MYHIAFSKYLAFKLIQTVEWRGGHSLIITKTFPTDYSPLFISNLSVLPVLRVYFLVSKSRLGRDFLLTNCEHSAATVRWSLVMITRQLHCKVWGLRNATHAFVHRLATLVSCRVLFHVNIRVVSNCHWNSVVFVFVISVLLVQFSTCLSQNEGTSMGYNQEKYLEIWSRWNRILLWKIILYQSK
jgi:hypothetical protein